MESRWRMQRERLRMLPASSNGSVRRHQECMEIPFQHQLPEIESSQSRSQWEFVVSSHRKQNLARIEQGLTELRWNSPAAMITRKIGPALAAGCTVVAKSPG